jgi:DNA-binding CsgD family transcriptional regulator
MITYAEIANLATEKDPIEKARLACEAFLGTTVFTGLAITYVSREERGERSHRFLYTHGYSDDALDYLKDTFIPTDPHFRAVVADPRVIPTWSRGEFVQSPAVRYWLSPAGYRNGFSLSVQQEGIGEIGSVHSNSYAPDFGDRQLEAALAFGELLKTVFLQKQAQDRARLTPREIHIVRLVAQGATNPEIADTLSVSRSTVATHIENILRKLDVTSRVRIAVEGTRLGLV